MTILFNQQTPEFDHNTELGEPDRAQPVGVESSDHFVVLTQQSGPRDPVHCILIERRDLEAFIDALRRS